VECVEEEEEEEEILAVESRDRCGGLVLCTPRMAEKGSRPLLDDLKPVVLVNRDVGSSVRQWGRRL
jgi:LacI family transcriptional regulator